MTRYIARTLHKIKMHLHHNDASAENIVEDVVMPKTRSERVGTIDRSGVQHFFFQSWKMGTKNDICLKFGVRNMPQRCPSVARQTPAGSG